VFRSQLPRVNAHYLPDPLPPLAGEDFPPDPASPAEGEWVELELVNEEEPGEEETVRNGPEEARVQAMLEEHRRREAEAEAAGSSGDEGGMANDGSDAGVDDDDMEEDETEAEREQECWDSFRERVGRAPDQSIRYDHGGREGPLWPSLEGRPESVPPCPRCGSPREFEFQVMPQCLLHLGQDELAPDALDWDSIVVYTCRDSCGPEDGGGGYVEEFAWVHRNAAGAVRANTR
jgi:pre-rRNA-processing protein TSR4